MGYTSVHEVEIIKIADRLVTVYALCFEAKYKTAPFLTADSHTPFRFLAKNYGEEKGLELVQAFFDMQDAWFTQNAHKPELLKTDINKILVFQSKRGVRKQLRGSAKRTTGILACDSCWSSFTAIYDIDTDWGKVMVRCPACISTNRPFRYPTKEEFEARMGSLALGMKYESVFGAKLPFPAPDLDYEINDCAQKEINV